MVPLLALIVFLGVYPKPVLDRIEPSVDRLLGHVEQRKPHHQPSVAAGKGAMMPCWPAAPDARRRSPLQLLHPYEYRLMPELILVVGRLVCC